ncbi:hypothetical protein SDC9_94444 [bioreactor metagenome]|uniref:Uncharacterized protein n=1 Tax=bioreactor metagenome TaxID=1076179 RepID=A0A645A3G7_9ZZZZ
MIKRLLKQGLRRVLRLGRGCCSLNGVKLHRAHPDEVDRARCHNDGKEYDEHCAHALHGIDEFSFQCGEERARAEHERNGAEREEQHGQSSGQYGTGRQRVELHCLQRPAGNQPVEQADHERPFSRTGFAEPRRKELWRTGNEPRGQPSEHAEPHKEHTDRREDQDDGLYRFAEEQHGTQPADDAADDRIGNHAAEIIQKRAAEFVFSGSARANALGKVNAAAHCYAVHAGEQARDKQGGKRNRAVDLRYVAKEIEADRIAQHKIQRNQNERDRNYLRNRLAFLRCAEQIVACGVDRFRYGDVQRGFVRYGRVVTHFEQITRKRSARARYAANGLRRFRNTRLAVRACHAGNPISPLFFHNDGPFI